jgi:hypothetical protein
MKILKVLYNFPLLPAPNENTLILADEMPPAHLITSALALAFSGRHILMTNLNAPS